MHSQDKMIGLTAQQMEFHISIFNQVITHNSSNFELISYESPPHQSVKIPLNTVIMNAFSINKGSEPDEPQREYVFV